MTLRADKVINLTVCITVGNSTWGKIMFSQVSVILCMGGGMHGKGGHCMAKGGHCMAKGACMEKGACMVGGIHRRGHAWGACVAVSVHGRGRVHGRGGACVAGRWPLQWMVRIPTGMYSCSKPVQVV